MERKRKNITEQEEEMAEYNRADREYYDTMPPGYRFVLTGEELIVNYLNKKVSDLGSLPINRIPNINIYDYHPQKLTSVYGLHRGKEWYFFTARNRKYPNSQRPDRIAGNGYWRTSGPDYPICNDQGIRIGTKKILVYYERQAKESNGIRTDWIMHEYRNQVDNTNNVGLVDKRDAKDMELDEFVLCVIFNKSYKEEVAIDNQQYGNYTMIVPANSNRLPSNQNPNGHTFPKHNVQLEPNPTTNQGQDGASFFNRDNLFVPDRNVRQRLDGGSSYNRSLMHTQNVQVPSPNTTQRQDDTRFYNRPSNLPSQNVQLPNLHITHGLNGLPFYNNPRLPLHNVQELNSNRNQFPYGGGLYNMGTLPMQNIVRMPMQNVQVPYPKIRQGLPTQNVQVPNPNIIQGPDGRSYYNMTSNLPRQNVQVPNLNITHGLNGLPLYNRPRSPLHNVQELNSNRNLFPCGGGFNNMGSLPMHNDEKNLYNMVNFPPSHYDQQQNLYGRNRPQAQSLGNKNANNQQVITPDPLEIVHAQYQTRSFLPQFVSPDPVEDESSDSNLPQEALQEKKNLNI